MRSPLNANVLDEETFQTYLFIFLLKVIQIPISIHFDDWVSSFIDTDILRMNKKQLLLPSDAWKIRIAWLRVYIVRGKKVELTKMQPFVPHNLCYVGVLKREMKPRILPERYIRWSHKSFLCLYIGEDKAKSVSASVCRRTNNKPEAKTFSPSFPKSAFQLIVEGKKKKIFKKSEPRDKTRYQNPRGKVICVLFLFFLFSKIWPLHMDQNTSGRRTTGSRNS